MIAEPFPAAGGPLSPGAATATTLNSRLESSNDGEAMSPSDVVQLMRKMTVTTAESLPTLPAIPAHRPADVKHLYMPSDDSPPQSPAGEGGSLSSLHSSALTAVSTLPPQQQQQQHHHHQPHHTSPLSSVTSPISVIKHEHATPGILLDASEDARVDFELFATPFSRSLSGEQLESVVEQFRKRIQLKTVMAFGLKHRRVFSGREAVSLLVEILSSEFCCSEDGDRSREDALAVAQRMVREYFVFGPLPVQNRKFKEADWLHKHGLVVDDESTLYRLTRDTLLLREFSNAYFDRFVARVHDGEKGVEFREGKIWFQRIAPEDCVFTVKAWNEWLAKNVGAVGKQSAEILKLLVERHAVEKLAFTRSYRFTALHQLHEVVEED